MTENDVSLSSGAEGAPVQQVDQDQKKPNSQHGRLGDRLKAFQAENQEERHAVVTEKTSVSKAKSIFQQNLENAKNMEASAAKTLPNTRPPPGKLTDKAKAFEKPAQEVESKPLPKSPGKLASKASMFEALNAQKLAAMGQGRPRAESLARETPPVVAKPHLEESQKVEESSSLTPVSDAASHAVSDATSHAASDATYHAASDAAAEVKAPAPAPGKLTNKAKMFEAISSQQVAASEHQKPSEEPDKNELPMKKRSMSMLNKAKAFERPVVEEKADIKRPEPGSLKSKVLAIGAALNGMQNHTVDEEKVAAPPPKRSNAMLDRINMLSGTLGKGPMPVGPKPPQSEEAPRTEAVSYVHDEYYTEEVEMKEMTEILALNDPLSSVLSGVNTIPLLNNYDLFLVPENLIKTYVRPAALDDPDYVYVQSSSVVRTVRPSRGRRPPTRK